MLIITQHWEESGTCRLTMVRGRRCWERVTIRFEAEAGWLRQDKEVFVDGLTAIPLRSVQFLRREGRPPQKLHG